MVFFSCLLFKDHTALLQVKIFMGKIRVTGCFIELDDKFLVLHRLPDKSQGDKWGIPAGKVDEGESDDQSVIREVWEKTGIVIPEGKIEFIQEIVWDFPEKTVEFPTFKYVLGEPIEVKFNENEHQDFKWVTGQECYQIPNLMHGVQDLLEKIGYVNFAGTNLT